MIIPSGWLIVIKKTQNVQRGHGLCMASESLLNIALYGQHQGKRKPLKNELIPPGEELLQLGP